MTNTSSMRGNSAVVFFLLFCLSSICGLNAEDRLAFADRLYFERDYFRAITEYKRERFYTDSPDTTWYCSVRIAESYWLSQKYEAALAELFAMGNPDALSPERRNWLLTSFALDYYGMKLYPNALMYLDLAVDSGGGNSARPRLYRGLILAETGKWDRSETDFSAVLHLVPETPESEAASFALEALGAARAAPRKSPTAAALMSAFLPGLGQWYAGHGFDALQAFATVGVFAFGTYGLYAYEQANGYPPIMSGTMGIVVLSLHSANIYGAYKTAGYYNQRNREDRLRPMRSAVFDLPPPGAALFDASGLRP